MVLSGGLGSSKYVQRRIREYFSQFTHPNARQVTVIANRNPQTTVVRGLLEDHKQKMETGNMPVLATYIARASYGVVVREPYSPDRHIGEQLEQDQFDPNQTWAVNQIEWIIRKVWISNDNPITLCAHSLTHLPGRQDRSDCASNEAVYQTFKPWPNGGIIQYASCYLEERDQISPSKSAKR